MVWKVKYSRKVLFGERQKYLKQVIEEIGEKYEYVIEAVGLGNSHVHVFAGAHPQISPAQMVQVIKSISARELFRKYPDMKRILWGGSLWAIGYYVRTVSDGPLDKVITKYVKAQGKEDTGNGKEAYQLRLVP